MIGLLAPAGLAMLLALALGGSFAGWAHLRVRWWPLAIGALGVQLVLHNPPIDQHPLALTCGPWVWVIAMLSMLAVLVRNSLMPGTTPWRIAAFGVALNVVVVVANGGFMPQSAEARDISRGLGRPADTEVEVSVHLRNVAPIGPETRLAWLGDVVPQPAWLPRANVVSLGDLLLSLGLGFGAFQITALVPRQRVRRPQLVEAQ